MWSIVLPGFPGNSVGKESACNAGDLGSIPGLGRSPGEGKGYPLQYLGLENSMDRGAWRATVHGVAESQPRLSDREHTSPSQALEFVPFHQDLDFDVIDLPGPSSPSFLGFFFFFFFFGCVGSTLLCRLSLVAGSKGYSLVSVLGLLPAVASLVELRL